MPEVLREGGRPKKLLTLVREAIRRSHMSGHTEESRVSGTRRYIYCHGKCHPATMGKPAAEGKVITSTRRSDREENFVDFTGTWDVVSSPDFDDEYLRLGGAPCVTIRQNGEFVKGEYRIGVMSGTINGGAHSDFFDFDFEGNDEMEDAFGEGEATLEGERLTFELWHYHGDEYTFVCERRE